MKTTIRVFDKAQKEMVHDYLVNSLSGIHTSLSGECICLDEHKWLDNYLEFYLTKEQTNEFNSLFAGVARAYVEIGTPTIDSWTKVDASFGKTFGTELAYKSHTNKNLLPHSMVFSQVPYNDNTKLNWTNGTSLALSSIDCSNVDIIIVDTGLDTTHPDISAQIVNFDWSVLKDGADGATGSSIVASLPANYHRDPNGHGTACGSLAAGRRCGLAKNARLYSMKINLGIPAAECFSATDGMKLLLAFMKAKKNNKHGLSSARPTVMSNSWGNSTSLNGMSNHKLQQQATAGGRTLASNPFSFMGYGDTDILASNGTNGASSLLNQYTELILAEGAHFLTAAGNSNHILDYSKAYQLSAMPSFVTFTSPAPSSIIYIAPYTVTNGTVQGIDNTFTSGSTYPLAAGGVNLTYNNNSGFGFVINSSLASGTTGASKEPLVLTCKSPGNTYTSYENSTINNLPCIIVGDVTPIGAFMSLADAYTTDAFSASNAAYCFNGLSALNTATGLPITPSTRYTSLSGVEYVKTSYSSFGPLVDIYACGNATWAAASNQAPAPSIVNTVSPNEKYKFFNGTSAATPVAAGALATYLAAHPTATNIQAKNWLINNAISGSILETNYYTIPLRVKTINLVTSTAGPNITMDFDSPFSITELTGTPVNYHKLNFNTSGSLLNTAYGLGRYETLTTAQKINTLRSAHQFYRSNNLVVQAYPLRKMIVDNNTKTTYTFLSSNFHSPVAVSRKKTHRHSEHLII